MTPVNTTVAIDPKLKAKALARAKKEQLSISAIIRIFLTDYAEGRLKISSQPVLTENGFTSEEEAEILQAADEAKRGINVSPSFDNMDDAIAFLNRNIQDKDDH